MKSIKDLFKAYKREVKKQNEEIEKVKPTLNELNEIQMNLLKANRVTLNTIRL